MRYYMIAEYKVHGEGTFIERNTEKGEGFLRECTGEDKVVSTDGGGREGSDRNEDQHEADNGDRGRAGFMGILEDREIFTREGKVPSDILPTDDEVLLTALPLYISKLYPLIPIPVSNFLMKDISVKDLEFLDLPLEALTAVWAARRLSIVGPYDRRTYCFTHSYGRLYDRSSGSLFYKDAEGPLSEEIYAIDR
jgi:hypothetical protein